MRRLWVHLNSLGERKKEENLTSMAVIGLQSNRGSKERVLLLYGASVES